MHKIKIKTQQEHYSALKRHPVQKDTVTCSRSYAPKQFTMFEHSNMFNLNENPTISQWQPGKDDIHSGVKQSIIFYRQQSYPSNKVFTHLSAINTSQLNLKFHLSADEIDGNPWIQCMYLRFGWGMSQGCILVPYGFRFSIAFLYNMFPCRNRVSPNNCSSLIEWLHVLIVCT